MAPRGGAVGGGMAPGGGAAGGPVGGPQCSAPHAESEVNVLDTTANGSCGSRVSSTSGSRVSSGATGAGGSSKAGRCFGAYAAICSTGGGDRERRDGRPRELGRALDRRVLRPVLPGGHAVMVDAGASG